VEQYPQIPSVHSADPADFVLLPFLDKNQPKDLLILGRQCIQDAVDVAFSFLSLELRLGIPTGASRFEAVCWKWCEARYGPVEFRQDVIAHSIYKGPETLRSGKLFAAQGSKYTQKGLLPNIVDSLMCPQRATQFEE